MSQVTEPSTFLNIDQAVLCAQAETINSNHKPGQEDMGFRGGAKCQYNLLVDSFNTGECDQ